MAATATFRPPYRTLRPAAMMQFPAFPTLRSGPSMRAQRSARQANQPAAFSRTLSTTATCQARLVPRPKRPYQFTQIVQLSDGSTYTTRTTSPHALYKSAKDSRNTIMWQPTDKSLQNLEADEAGKLAAFRNRFGRGWDVASAAEGEDASPKKGEKADASDASVDKMDAFDALSDLLSGYAEKEDSVKSGGMSAKDQAKMDKSAKKK